MRSVLDRSDHEDVRLHQPHCANASAFGLRGYVDTLSPLVAMHHLLGNVLISKKILCTRKIVVMHNNERGECVHVPS